jgi:hypothetical protein
MFVDTTGFLSLLKSESDREVEKKDDDDEDAGGRIGHSERHYIY